MTCKQCTESADEMGDRIDELEAQLIDLDHYLLQMARAFRRHLVEHGCADEALMRAFVKDLARPLPRTKTPPCYEVGPL